MSDEYLWDKIDNPDIEKRFEAAKEIREKMGIYGPGGQVKPSFYEISVVHTQGLMEWCFGMVWGDGGDHREHPPGGPSRHVSEGLSTQSARSVTIAPAPTGVVDRGRWAG